MAYMYVLSMQRHQQKPIYYKPTSLSMKDYAISLGKKAMGEELAGRPTGIVDTGMAGDILEAVVPNILGFISDNKSASVNI